MGFGSLRFPKSHIQEIGIISVGRLAETDCPSSCESASLFDGAGCSAPMLKCELRPALTVPDVHRITTRAVFMLLLRAGRLDRQARTPLASLGNGITWSYSSLSVLMDMSNKNNLVECISESKDNEWR